MLEGKDEGGAGLGWAGWHDVVLDADEERSCRFVWVLEWMFWRKTGRGDCRGGGCGGQTGSSCVLYLGASSSWAARGGFGDVAFFF